MLTRWLREREGESRKEERERQGERGRGGNNLCIIIMTGLGKTKQVKSEEKSPEKKRNKVDAALAECSKSE